MEAIRCYEIKLKPNSSQKQQLDNYFYEAKLLYNYLLNCSNIFAVNACKVKHIWKLDKNGNQIPVELTSLPAKLKQNVHRQMLSSIQALSASKQKGYIVSHLKFKSKIKTIDIDNQSYSIVDAHHIKLLGFGRQSIYCFGLKQFQKDVIKFRNAKLIKQDDEYFMKICITKSIEDHQPCGQNIGIDFGVETSISLSTGEKKNCKISESKQLKKTQQTIARSLIVNNRRRTNNQIKLRKKLHRQYQKLINQKNEFVNQLMYYLNQFDYIVFQDEQIRSWKNLKGNTRTIQHSCLGMMKQRLKIKVNEEPAHYIMLDKWIPTTQLCPNCGQKNKHKLSERTYHCSCGYVEDRDIHAARNMLLFAGLTV